MRTEAEIGQAVAEGKEEILADMQRALVPATLTAYAQLHDHVDANGYCGFASERADWELEDMNRVMDQLDAWLRER